MAGVNKVIILGRLGKDPEMRSFDSGSQVCRIVVATSETYNDKQGQKVEKTEWHNISFWGKLADIANKYLKKGSEVYVEGKLQTNSYESDGITKYSTEILANSMNLIGGRPEGSAQTQNTAQATSSAAAPKPMSPQSATNSALGGNDDDDDDLPF